MEVKGTRSSSADNYSKTSSSSSSSSTLQTCTDEDLLDLRRGPWTVEEDFKLINYIANHGEGRWNSLARSAGLRRTGKSCRLRWLNYLRPDVRRGNITLEEQLLILELHSHLGNRWSKIAQHLPGRTDNEIKNYWRTRVQKQAKQLKCDVNSKQFKDTMRYLWMPRLLERIQATNNATDRTAAAAAATTGSNSTGPNTTTTMAAAAATAGIGHNNITPSYTPDNSSTAASSESFGTPISDLADYYAFPASDNPNLEYYYSESFISPSAYFNPGIEFQEMEPTDYQLLDDGEVDAVDNFWNVKDIWSVPKQFNSNM